MPQYQNDGLLTAGRVMTVLLMGLTLAVTAVLIGLIPVTIFMPEALFDNASISGAALGAAITLLLLAAAVTAGAFYFFKLLGEMIKSVAQDNPFSLKNADRLSRMGWIALIFQLASFPIGALAIYLGHLVPSDNLTVDYEFSLTGFLLAIVLFILARVFRHGAAMREDLEGTV